MPKLVDKQAINKCIMSQTGTFTPDDIASTMQVSSAICYVQIRDLKSQGQVIMDHKDGHRMFYAVSNGTRTGVGSSLVSPEKTNIMSLTPAERFKYVSYLTDMVIDGISPSLLITGVSGIGKTHLVKKQLEKSHKIDGIDFHFVQGHSSPMGLYSFLYNHRDAIIVFDDCDSVFGDESAINILKSALDSYETRKVSWLSARMPVGMESEFNFTGQIVFISNMDASRIDEAVKSRTIVIDLQMSRSEIAEYLKELIDVIETKMARDQKLEVLQYLSEHCNSFSQFNIRTFIKACRIRQMAETHHTDWKKMIMVLN